MIDKPGTPCYNPDSRNGKPTPHTGNGQRTGRTASQHLDNRTRQTKRTRANRSGIDSEVNAESRKKCLTNPKRCAIIQVQSNRRNERWTTAANPNGWFQYLDSSISNGQTRHKLDYLDRIGRQGRKAHGSDSTGSIWTNQNRKSKTYAWQIRQSVVESRQVKQPHSQNTEPLWKWLLYGSSGTDWTEVSSVWFGLQDRPGAGRTIKPLQDRKSKRKLTLLDSCRK